MTGLLGKGCQRQWRLALHRHGEKCRKGQPLRLMGSTLGSDAFALPPSAGLMSPSSTTISKLHCRANNEIVRSFATRRRKRDKTKWTKYNNPEFGTCFPTTPGLDSPFEYSGDTLEEYSEKASLSPWTPVPDVAAMRIFDIAQAQEDDIHVELGSGDGRVNFFAIEAGVKESIGIDVDEDIVKVANDRLVRIHPQPNISFRVADLTEHDNEIWKEISRATILTMYFAKPGLEKIQPLLENALLGKRCKVFTCGYAMPGWQSQREETVLDMTIYFYDWGNEDVEDSFFSDPTMIDNAALPEDFLTAGMQNKLVGRRKNSTYKPDPLKGYHPDDLYEGPDDWGNGDDDTDQSEDNEKGVPR